MKITAVTGYPVHIGHRNQFVVKVETDAGISGVGEGGISGRELAMQGMLDHFHALLIGEDPHRIEHLWQLMYRGAYFEGGKITGAVISAIDIALWDILGKSLDVPVWQLIGGRVRDRVPCFATPGALSGPEIVDVAVAAADAGWNILRFTPGMADEGWTGVDGAVYEPLESIDVAVALLHRLRRELPPRVRLAVDFHHRLNPAEASYFCRQIEDVNLLFLEEPIRCEDPAAYHQLRKATNIPFAIGEEFSSKWAFAPYLEGGLINYARIDVCNVGGITEARKIAGWCETHYIDLVPHNPLGPISTAALVHLGVATSNYAWLEHFLGYTVSTPRDLFPAMLDIEGTAFEAPTAPGLGVEFDESAVPDYPYQEWMAPRWFRRDGAYTNW